jgi:hypothetical protein
MDYAEVVLLVMIVAWFMPMALLVSFLMWRYAVPELDAWVLSVERHSMKELIQRQAQKREAFAFDLNNIDLTKVTASMLKPKVSASRLAV